MKKVFSTILIIAILASLFSLSVFAKETLLISPKPEISFSDVNKDTEEGKAIYKLAQAGIILGDGDGTFRPNDSITRAELSKIVNMIFNYTEKDAEGFTDVNTSHWYYDSVLTAKKAGYIVGFQDGTFRGEENVSREQACTILCRVSSLYDINLNFEIKDEVSDWAMPYVQRVLANAQMSLEEGNTFRATQNITRAEFCIAFANFYVPPVKYNIELKNNKGQITDAKTEITDGEIFITLPDRLVISTVTITVTVKDEAGNPVKDVKVTAVDKNNVKLSLKTDANGIVKLQKSGGGGGGSGDGGNNNSNNNNEDPALTKLKNVSKDISSKISKFPKPNQYLFITEVKKGIDKVIEKAPGNTIDSDFVKGICKTEIDTAKSYFDEMLKDEIEKQKLIDSIATLNVDTINWLIDYFDIDMDRYI